MKKYKVLIVGKGGREHALAWKVTQSPLVENVYVAPGNYGTMNEPNVKNVNIEMDNVESLVNFAINEQVDLTIVGPEISLSVGIVDKFNDNNLLCFGPTQRAATLETSKFFAKQFMDRCNIPTANYRSFTSFNQAISYVNTLKSFPLVIKKDGLDNGKGVIIVNCFSEACEVLYDILVDSVSHFSKGMRVVIEQFIAGKELSYMCVVDDQDFISLGTSADYKKAFDGNKGPNTGGMGSISPVNISQELETKIRNNIVKPTLKGLKREGIIYRGFLYFGIMIDQNDNPILLEYNCRLGDPETQSVLFRLNHDLVDIILKSFSRELNTIHLTWDHDFVSTVVLASRGYPSNPTTDYILDIKDINGPHLKAFYSGIDENSNVVGGRVLSLTAKSKHLDNALINTYNMINEIKWPLAIFRTDIGK